MIDVYTEIALQFLRFKGKISDKGRSDVTNVIRVILEVYKNKRYMIGIKVGVVDRLLERNVLKLSNVNVQ